MDFFSEDIRHVLTEIVEKNILDLDSLKHRIFDCIQRLSENEAIHILDSFANSDLSGVNNRENFLYECFLDHIKLTPIPGSSIKLIGSNIKDISKKCKIEELLNRTKYTLSLSSGQRKYGGPPPDWEGPPPNLNDSKACSQVHIRKLGSHDFEDVIVPALEQCGKIWQLRIMVDKNTGENRGFAFVDFFTKEQAVSFVEKYNNKPLGSSRSILAKIAVPNTKIIINGIPTSIPKNAVEIELSNILKFAQTVKAFSNDQDIHKNKGFAYLTFKNHNDANLARKRIISGQIKIFDFIVQSVEWAEDSYMDDEIKHKTLHIRLLGGNLDEKRLKSLFSEYGVILSLSKFTDFAFVEFDSDKSAQAALMILNDKKVDGSVLKISFAKSSKYNGKKGPLKRVHQQSYEQPPNWKSNEDHFNDQYSSISGNHVQNVPSNIYPSAYHHHMNDHYHAPINNKVNYSHGMVSKDDYLNSTCHQSHSPKPSSKISNEKTIQFDWNHASRPLPVVDSFKSHLSYDHQSNIPPRHPLLIDNQQKSRYHNPSRLAIPFPHRYPPPNQSNPQSDYRKSYH